MASIKAPKGGIVSPVNGQFYEGGEFVPDHGHYCGKGKNRVSQVEFDKVSEDALALNWTLEFNEQFGRFQLVLSGGNVMMSASNLATLAKTVQTLTKPKPRPTTNPW